MRRAVVAAALCVPVLLLGSGCSGERALVPEVVGMTDQEAREVLEQAGFEADNAKMPSKTTIVQSQDPMAGKAAAKGGRVALFP